MFTNAPRTRGVRGAFVNAPRTPCVRGTHGVPRTHGVSDAFRTVF